VTRKIGLSRENPQYWQLLMHSLDKYSGANSRIVRPKNRRVIICDWPASSANRVSSIGSSKLANCVIVRLLGLSGKLNNRANVIPGKLVVRLFQATR
jgi:hypothetical protein